MSRLDKIIEAVEAGEPIDWPRERLLCDLEIARLGEQFVIEQLEAERKADERLPGAASD